MEQHKLVKPKNWNGDFVNLESRVAGSIRELLALEFVRFEQELDNKKYGLFKKKHHNLLLIMKNIKYAKLCPFLKIISFIYSPLFHMINKKFPLFVIKR